MKIQNNQNLDQITQNGLLPIYYNLIDKSLMFQSQKTSAQLSHSKAKTNPKSSKYQDHNTPKSKNSITQEEEAKKQSKHYSASRVKSVLTSHNQSNIIPSSSDISKTSEFKQDTQMMSENKNAAFNTYKQNTMKTTENKIVSRDRVISYGQTLPSQTQFINEETNKTNQSNENTEIMNRHNLTVQAITDEQITNIYQRKDEQKSGENSPIILHQKYDNSFLSNVNMKEDQSPLRSGQFGVTNSWGTPLIAKPAYIQKQDDQLSAMLYQLNERLQYLESKIIQHEESRKSTQQQIENQTQYMFHLEKKVQQYHNLIEDISNQLFKLQQQDNDKKSDQQKIKQNIDYLNQQNKKHCENMKMLNNKFDNNQISMSNQIKKLIKDQEIQNNQQLNIIDNTNNINQLKQSLNVIQDQYIQTLNSTNISISKNQNLYQALQAANENNVLQIIKVEKNVLELQNTLQNGQNQFVTWVSEQIQQIKTQQIQTQKIISTIKL